MESIIAGGWRLYNLISGHDFNIFANQLRIFTVMKKILIIVTLLSASIICNGQDYIVDVTEINTELVRVFETSVNSAVQKHLLSKEWVAKSFGDYNSVLQFEDDSNFKIIVKGQYAMSDRRKLSFTITIDSKDDKYRVRLSDLLIKEYVTQISGVLKHYGNITEIHNSPHANATKFIQIGLVDYVTIADDIKCSQMLIAEAKARLAVIDDEVSARHAELDLEIQEQKNRPRGTTRVLYRGLLRQEKDRCYKEALSEKDSLSQIVVRENRNVIEYKQRIPDVENALTDLLKSLYLKLNTSDDF